MPSESLRLIKPDNKNLTSLCKKIFGNIVVKAYFDENPEIQTNKNENCLYWDGNSPFIIEFTNSKKVWFGTTEISWLKTIK